MNAVLLIAHAPLAHALRQAALHVFPDAASDIVALDVHPNVPPEETLATAQAALGQLAGRDGVLLLADVFGATPCNVAARLVDGERTRLLAGVNLPMLLRAVTYRHEPLEATTQRALAGGTQGIMPVAVTAPQNQARRAPNDQERHDHQQ
ncbi:PTS fructose transporter subunit IIA [Ottowia sp.]|jgi:PTS system ascorbate-specific IIA component|uniref:PTS sugar transporter subunit IIA n=1 Tax=Ottowia sp. TaxID=1898956 RepID=UPI0025DABF5E|nr:PTS fructose transporter subunit IIA [Ottowia sp.]MBK6615193.1 PTS fructose transporter subunit IIA [Ottowia sp.]MBK6746269.1 PTS fructose transporter subunit IIA [Ottowia sp.]